MDSSVKVNVGRLRFLLISSISNLKILESSNDLYNLGVPYIKKIKNKIFTANQESVSLNFYRIGLEIL